MSTVEGAERDLGMGSRIAHAATSLPGHRHNSARPSGDTGRMGGRVAPLSVPCQFVYVPEFACFVHARAQSSLRTAF